MSKIQFQSEGATYTLEFDRETAMEAERLYDISVNEVSQGKVSYLAPLFFAALKKHHPHMKATTKQALFDKMGNRAELYQRLSVMFAETASSVLEDPDEGNALTWKAI